MHLAFAIVKLGLVQYSSCMVMVNPWGSYSLPSVCRSLPLLVVIINMIIRCMICLLKLFSEQGHIGARLVRTFHPIVEVIGSEGLFDLLSHRRLIHDICRRDVIPVCGLLMKHAFVANSYHVNIRVISVTNA